LNGKAQLEAVPVLPVSHFLGTGILLLGHSPARVNRVIFRSRLHQFMGQDGASAEDC